MKVTALILRGDESAAELSKKLDAFVRETTAILNGGVRLSDQLSAEIKSIRYTGGASLSVSTRFQSKPATLMVLSASQTAAESATQSGNRITWSYADGFITITDINGLSASTEYAVTLAIVEA